MMDDNVIYPEKALKGCAMWHEIDAGSIDTQVILADVGWEMCEWLIFKDSIKFTVVGLEDDVIGLREAHDEDKIDDKESEKVFGNHPVYHDHKGADDLKCPGMMSHRVCLKY